MQVPHFDTPSFLDLPGNNLWLTFRESRVLSIHVVFVLGQNLTLSNLQFCWEGFEMFVINVPDWLSGSCNQHEPVYLLSILGQNALGLAYRTPDRFHHPVPLVHG